MLNKQQILVNYSVLQDRVLKRKHSTTKHTDSVEQANGKSLPGNF
jgi:hypothetical protein